MSEAIFLVSLFALIVWTAATLDLIFEKFQPERSLASTGTTYTSRSPIHIYTPLTRIHVEVCYSYRASAYVAYFDQENSLIKIQ